MTIVFIQRYSYPNSLCLKILLMIMLMLIFFPADNNMTAWSFLISFMSSTTQSLLLTTAAPAAVVVLAAKLFSLLLVLIFFVTKAVYIIVYFSLEVPLDHYYCFASSQKALIPVRRSATPFTFPNSKYHLDSHISCSSCPFPCTPAGWCSFTSWANPITLDNLNNGVLSLTAHTIAKNPNSNAHSPQPCASSIGRHEKGKWQNQTLDNQQGLSFEIYSFHSVTQCRHGFPIKINNIKKDCINVMFL